MTTLARRDSDSPAATPAARALIEQHPSWPLLATLALVLALAGLTTWLLPTLLDERPSARERVGEGAEDVGACPRVEAEEHR